MYNPMNMIFAMQLEMLHQYLTMVKKMMEISVAMQPKAANIMPLMPNISARSGGCVGPADLKS